MAVKLRDYLTLYELARRRLDSLEAYRAFQRFQGELLVNLLVSRGIEVSGQHVLDLGCGVGGYSLALQDHGARVVGLDMFPPPELGIKLVRADALTLPLQPASFDMVICASLIEHVPSATGLVQEIHRVLRAGGVAYLSFPPFYSPIGGHQFSPFHLFGERVALRVVRLDGLYQDKQWLQERFPVSPSSFSQAFGDWGLYPRTIAGVEQVLRAFPFQRIERSTRWLPIDFSGVPVLGEFLTWHVQFLLRKPV